MAEVALITVTQALLKQLGSRLLQEAALLWAIGGDIKKLTDTLSIIQAVLLDAEEKSFSPQNHQLRFWLKELREAAYDAEDLLDDFFTEVKRRHGMADSGSERIWKEVGRFFSSSNQVAYGLRIFYGIKTIRANLEDIAKRGEMFHLQVKPVESTVRKDREETHSGLPHIVVGRDADLEKIVELLISFESEDSISVLPIVGIGGLGKTTLAQLVFNHKSIQSHFQLKAWVCVSENFDVKLVVEKLIESCTKEKPERGLQMDTLKELLHQAIHGKRCLIMLDDVWNEDEEKWSRLKSLLMGGDAARGSRVMITTRLQKVAELVTTMEWYELKGLEDDESWDLFRRVAFKGGEVKDGRYESIGRGILQKCKGVPLAIKAIASALFFKKSETEWVAFSSKEMWKIDQGENGIMPTLKLSYDPLPTHLKHCFAFCKLFSKDHRINVKTLIQLWIAQGYIQLPDALNQFEEGLECFKNLLWRSFFQEEEKDELGNIEFCKMHDLMHDLAATVAGEACVRYHISNIPDVYDRHFGRTRHVSFDHEERYTCKSWQVMIFMVNSAEKLRTLLSVEQASEWDEIDYDQLVFSNTTSLRVLDLSHFWITTVSPTIHKLKHLRYLDLSYNAMTLLPGEITELVNLEVLKLEDCWNLEQLPKDIRKLSNLAHLVLDGCEKLQFMPLGIGQLYHLIELSVFVVVDVYYNTEKSAAAGGIGELGYLKKLRGSLTIQNLGKLRKGSEGKAAKLSEKQHLETLVLSFCSGEPRCLSGAEEAKLLEALRPHPNLKVISLESTHVLESPSWLSSLTNLVEVRIRDSPYWKRLPSLDQLPFLAELQLTNLESLEYIECDVVTPSSFYLSLKSLSLAHCPNFKGWATPQAGVPLPPFPLISEVFIAGCRNITSIPNCSLNLRSLRLTGGTKELLKQILRVIIPSSPSPQSSSTSHLEFLNITGMLDLDTLPEELLPHLSSVRILMVNECPMLRKLSSSLAHHLTSLEQLQICDCEEVELCDDDAIDQVKELHGALLPSLCHVVFTGTPKLTALPEWLQLAPNLETLWTNGCLIKCFPEWMSKLKELVSVRIDEYGKSAQECMAEDWPKISHVRGLTINGVTIQEDGRCLLLEEEQTSEVGAEAATEDEEDEATAAQEEEMSVLLRWFMNCAIFRRCFGG